MKKKKKKKKEKKAECFRCQTAYGELCTPGMSGDISDRTLLTAVGAPLMRRLYGKKIGNQHSAKDDIFY